MAERWLPVVGHEDSYEVSSWGRVRSLARTVERGGHAMKVAARVLRPGAWSSGHPVVTLWRDGKSRTWGVHQLVARAHLGAPADDSLEVCHNDGNPSNNRVENLRWDSHAANMADAMRHGSTARGRALPQSVLDEKVVKRIREDYAAGLGTHRSFAKAYGVSHQTIGALIRGKSWAWVGQSAPSEKEMA